MCPSPPNKHFTPTQLALAAAVTAMLAAACAPPAQAQAGNAVNTAPLTIDIPAQPLGQALNELARQGALQLSFPAAQVAGKTTPAVYGQMSIRQAFARLLAGSGLAASIEGSMVVVQPAPRGAAEDALRAPPAEVVVLPAVTVTATAEQALRQAPGVSIISAEDIRERPPANDLSEIVRTMPGVNLTGNSSSGQYGNNRQIDIRGMGPENTLILIDGIPVNSRNSTRMGRSGERNTRGDSNWVPAEAVDSIEVLRGPAAARYGSGASGGVVNILTKRPTQTLGGSVTYYTNQPESGDEQATNRIGMTLAGPLGDRLSFRFFGSANKTEADQLGLNQDFATGATPPAGREGVRNRDANLLLRWDLTDAQTLELNTGFSRQGNIYAGDRAMNSSYQGLSDLAQAGAETNTKYRRTASVTHRGNWGERRTSRLGLAYEGTEDRRLREGLTGGSEGAFARDPTINQAATSAASTSELKNWLLNGEFTAPVRIGTLEQMLTVGFDARNEQLDDPYAMSNSNVGAGVLAGRSSTARAANRALFVESNIALTEQLLLTPGVRYDHHSELGGNWGPSLNASYFWTPAISLKAGVARAFKAPNLYQSDPNYLWDTNGNGCPVNWPRPNNAGCVIVGNPELKPETSVNKEIGIAYDADGHSAGLTYFHNDYKNKIVADMPDQTPVLLPNRSYLFEWSNADTAIVRGLEGHWTTPILGRNGDRLKWINNFTYMIENKNRTTVQPLAITPKYTVNSSLDWRATDKVSVLVTATFYGKQAPRSKTISGAVATGVETTPRKSYHLIGASIGYAFHPRLHGRFGVSNIFNKRLYREHNQTGAGAATYNEAGRALYATMTASF